MPRRISLSGGLAILAVILFLMAWNRGIALLYGMFYLVLATLAVGYAAPGWNLRKVAVRRSHAPDVIVGQALGLTLVLTQRGWFSRYMLGVRDSVPCAVPEDQEPVALVERVSGSASVSMQVRCDWRGEHTLGPVTLESGFPLGLRVARRSVPGSESRVLVYPGTFEVASFPYLTASFLSMAKTSPAAAPGNSMEFLNVREYVRGDNPRYVHWPLSAHRGALVVRQFEKISHADVCLLLNLDRRAVHGNGRDSTFEYAVRIAASVAKHALDHGHRVRLAGYGQVPLLVPPGRGPQQLRRLLEALAWVQPGDGIMYGLAVQRAQRELGEGALLVSFERADRTGGSLERDLSFPRRLRPVRMLFDVAGFDRRIPGPASKPQTPGAAEPSYIIRYGDDLPVVFGAGR